MYMKPTSKSWHRLVSVLPLLRGQEWTTCVSTHYCCQSVPCTTVISIPATDAYQCHCPGEYSDSTLSEISLSISVSSGICWYLYQQQTPVNVTVPCRYMSYGVSVTYKYIRNHSHSNHSRICTRIHQLCWCIRRWRHMCDFHPHIRWRLQRNNNAEYLCRPISYTALQNCLVLGSRIMTWLYTKVTSGHLTAVSNSQCWVHLSPMTSTDLIRSPGISFVLFCFFHHTASLPRTPTNVLSRHLCPHTY